MSLTITDKGGSADFPKLEKGIYEGTLYSIVDLGTRLEAFGNDEPKPKHQVTLAFEITAAVRPENNQTLMEDGRPFAVSKKYTLSLHEKAALRLDVESWRGMSLSDEELRGFDLVGLLGMTAKIEVGHTNPMPDGTGGGNPKIIALREPAGGSQKVPTKNEQKAFDLEIYCEEFNGNSSPKTKAMCDVFDSLPEWQQKQIQESFEYLAASDDAAAPNTRAANNEDLGRLSETAVAAQEIETPQRKKFEDDEIPF